MSGVTRTARWAAIAVAAIMTTATAGAVSAGQGDPNNVNLEPYKSQAHEPLLETVLVGGTDTVATDDAGIGAEHLRRVPPAGELTDVELAIVDDTIAAINFERARRDTDPGPDFSAGSYPLRVSDNMTRIQHRWAEWLSNWYDTRTGADVGESCPMGQAIRSCHALWPNWDDGVFYNSGITFRTQDGGAIVGPTSTLPGGWATVWTQSTLHRSSVLSNTVRFATVAVDCRSDGKTFVEWVGGDYDPAILLAEPAVAPNTPGNAVLPDGELGNTALVSSGFGHRCPQPAHDLEIEADANGLVLRAVEGGNDALKTTYHYDLDGPVETASVSSWRVAVTVVNTTTDEVIEEEFDAYGEPDGGVFGDRLPLEIDGLSDGEYTLSWRWVNDFEESLRGETEFSVGDGEVVLPGPPEIPVESLFTGMAPKRLIDTRIGLGGNTLTAIQGVKYTPQTPAGAYMLNVTAVNGAGPGHLTVYPCAEGKPATSNVNWSTSRVRANAVVARPDANGAICFVSSTTVDLVVDITGTFADEPDALSLPAPTRLWDSRTNGEPRPAGKVTVFDVGTDTAAAIWNVTVAAPQAPGHVTVYPCADGKPTASNVNHGVGGAVAGLVMATPDAAGKVCVYSLAPAELIVDEFGAIAAGVPAAEFVAPFRLLDSRNTDQRGTKWMIEIPDELVGAAVLNVTAVNPAGAGHVTAYPCTSLSDPVPTVSLLNYQPATAVPNLTVIEPGPTGRVCFASHAVADLVVDVTGALS